MVYFSNRPISLACDVHPYVKRIGDEGHEACAYYAKLAWMVDPFHIKGHKVSSNCVFIRCIEKFTISGTKM